MLGNELFQGDQNLLEAVRIMKGIYINGIRVSVCFLPSRIRWVECIQVQEVPLSLNIMKHIKFSGTRLIYP